MRKPSAVTFLMPASSRTTGSTGFFAARPRIVRTWSSIEAYVADRSAGDAGADGATEPPALGEAVGAGVWLADGDGLTDGAADWHAADDEDERGRERDEGAAASAGGSDGSHRRDCRTQLEGL